MKPVLFFSAHERPLVKSHVDQYTRADGTVVQAHDDNRVTAAPHPSGKHKPGDNVFFPHPEKAGKKALGAYVGQHNGQSIVQHPKYGARAVPHEHVTGARGVIKGAANASLRSPHENAGFVSSKATGKTGSVASTSADGQRHMVRWSDGSKSEHHHSELNKVND